MTIMMEIDVLRTEYEYENTRHLHNRISYLILSYLVLSIDISILVDS